MEVPRACGSKELEKMFLQPMLKNVYNMVDIFNIVDHFISGFELSFYPDFYGILTLGGLIPSNNAIDNDDDIIHAALIYNWFFRSSEFRLKSEFKILGTNPFCMFREPETTADNLKE
ncbi:hypothetical protein AVEN_194284-1 [Araneus ventricosus]|uniref:Uncharacterized protein n=1 Tax=Araneus ventricosus TaxID=182803 RepID=A0A4Y2G0I1_ARAVE|nr:hypothetical protein AVEN_194284-1 [Araneus ventricosus]